MGGVEKKGGGNGGLGDCFSKMTRLDLKREIW